MNKKIVIGIAVALIILVIVGVVYAISKVGNKPVETLENNEGGLENISNLDEFYSLSLTKDKDIRNLPEGYTSFDAQKDNCFVVGAMVHNDNLYTEFMNDYKNKKTAFIRVAQNTIEGDLVLYDILYYNKTDRLYIVNDSTRDKYTNEATIYLGEYKNISECAINNHLYWVLYNETITDENFQTDNVFVITTIN